MLMMMELANIARPDLVASGGLGDQYLTSRRNLHSSVVMLFLDGLTAADRYRESSEAEVGPFRRSRTSNGDIRIVVEGLSIEASSARRGSVEKTECGNCQNWGLLFKSRTWSPKARLLHAYRTLR